MSVSAAQAAQFFDEAVKHACVWTIRDAGGFPAPKNADGERVQPFWSLESRAQKVIDTVPAYHGFDPHKLSLQEFKDRWLPGLERDGLLVGINWSGDGATGYDIKPEHLRSRLNSTKR